MDKQLLRKTYKHKIELHAHSMPASPCCDCSMDRFLELYSQKGVEAICLTNHFNKGCQTLLNKSKKDGIDAYLDDYEKLKELSKPYGIKILLGCEIRFSENSNDYLIYGVNREILEEAYDYLDSGLVCFRKNVKLPNSLFIQAHPFRDGIVQADPELIDGIESLNFHPHHNNRNSACAEFAKINNIGICTGGSDFHHDKYYHPGALLTLSKTLPQNSFELAQILKSGDYIFLLGDNHIIIP